MDLDPYRDWLKVRDERRPPGHYQLLGFSGPQATRSEIEAAYARQMQTVRRYQVGAHMEVAQRLISELSEAYVCLSDPRRREAYDATLRGGLTTQEAPSTPEASPPAPPAKPRPLAPIVKTPTPNTPVVRGPAVAVPSAPTVSRARGRQARRKTPPSLIAGAVVTLLTPPVIWFAVTSPPDAAPSPEVKVETSVTDATPIAKAEVPKTAPPEKTDTSAASPDVAPSLKPGMVFEGERTNAVTGSKAPTVVKFHEIENGKVTGIANVDGRFDQSITGTLDGDKLAFTVRARALKFEGFVRGDVLDLTYAGTLPNRGSTRGKATLKLRLEAADAPTAQPTVVSAPPTLDQTAPAALSPPITPPITLPEPPPAKAAAPTVAVTISPVTMISPRRLARPANGVAWSPDSTRLLLAAEPASLFDAATGQELQTLASTECARASWSFDGRLVAMHLYGKPPVITVYEVDTGKPVLSVETFKAGGALFGFSPTAASLAVIHPKGSQNLADFGKNLVTLFKLGPGKQSSQVLEEFRYPARLAWKSDGSSLAWSGFGANRGVRVARVPARGSTLVGATFDFEELRWIPNHRFLAGFGDQGLCVLDLSAPKKPPVLQLAGVTKPAHGSFSSDGQLAGAIVGNEVSTFALDNAKGPRWTKSAGQNTWQALAWSPTVTRLAALDSSGIIHVWDETGQLVATLNAQLMAGSSGGLSFSPDGKRLLAHGLDYKLLIFDTSQLR